MKLMYLRKSRSDDSSLTVKQVLEKHLNILQDYCLKTYGKQLPEEFIYREVVSGETISDRPEMKKILKLVSSGDVESVLVVEPQRLSRGDLLDCGTICRVFKYSDTKIETPVRTYNLADDYDLKFFEMELKQGNEYLNYLIKIMHRGKVQSAKSGQFVGSVPPFGYDKVIVDKKHTLQPNDKAEMVKLIFEYGKQGYSSGVIAKMLNERGITPPKSDLWCQRTVERILNNVIYLGKIAVGTRKTVRTVNEDGDIVKKVVPATPEVFPALHQAIIDEETFNAVQQLRGQHSRKPFKKRFTSPLASLAKCGVCGRCYTLMTFGGRKRPRFSCQKRGCENRSVSYDYLMNEVVKGLKSKLKDIEIEIGGGSPDNTSLISTLKKELASLERQQSRLYELLEKEIYSESVFTKRNAELADRRQRLESALAEAERSEPVDVEQFRVTLHQVIDELPDASIPAEEKNKLLKVILKKITVTRLGENEPVVRLYF